MPNAKNALAQVLITRELNTRAVRDAPEIRNGRQEHEKMLFNGILAGMKMRMDNSMVIPLSYLNGFWCHVARSREL